MKFEFKPVRMWIDLREYNPELVVDDGTDPLIPVWVNVPRELFHRMFPSEPVKVADSETFTLLGELWGSDWPEDDIRALYGHCSEHDPRLWIWLVQRTWRLVSDYQAGQKKG